MTLMVLAPMVQFRVSDPAGGTVLVHRYAGSPVPDTIHPDDERRGLDEGWLVEEGVPVAERFAVPAGTPLPGQPPNVPVGLTGLAATTAQPVPPFSMERLSAADVDASGEEPFAVAETDEEQQAREARRGQQAAAESSGLPRKNASEASWREFHAAQLRAQGVGEQSAQEQADGLSRDDIRARYAE